MSPDERDAFGNPIGPSGAPAPDLGGFAPPVAPAPKQAPPTPPQRHVIATGHPLPGGQIPVVPPTAPGATLAIVLGIVGIVVWLVAPVAWIRGREVLRTIDASAGRLGGRGLASVAQILGIIGTCLLLLSIVGAIIRAGGHGG